MTTTAAQRTAAHAAFIARAAFIVELCFRHGSTDGGASFPTDAHTASFYADIEAYDTASVKPEPIAAQVSATIDLGADLPAPFEGVAAAQVGVERRAASVAAMVKVGVDQPHDHARLASDIAALDAQCTAPLVTTRRMALATLCDDIEQAEGLTAANQVVLNVLTREGRALPHHHARLAFDNAAIDIMWANHAALLGNSLEDRA